MDSALRSLIFVGEVVVEMAEELTGIDIIDDWPKVVPRYMRQVRADAGQRPAPVPTHSRRSAALGSRILQLSFGRVLEASVLRTMSNGGRQTISEPYLNHIQTISEPCPTEGANSPC